MRGIILLVIVTTGCGKWSRGEKGDFTLMKCGGMSGCSVDSIYSNKDSCEKACSAANQSAIAGGFNLRFSCAAE